MNYICDKCGNTTRQYTAKLIPSGYNKEVPHLHVVLPFPKYIPQIKESCAKCGRYNRFVPQTPEIIDLINEVLSIKKIPVGGGNEKQE